MDRQSRSLSRAGTTGRPPSCYRPAAPLPSLTVQSAPPRCVRLIGLRRATLPPKVAATLDAPLLKTGGAGRPAAHLRRPLRLGAETAGAAASLRTSALNCSPSVTRGDLKTGGARSAPWLMLRCHPRRRFPYFGQAEALLCLPPVLQLGSQQCCSLSPSSPRPMAPPKNLLRQHYRRPLSRPLRRLLLR